MGCSVRSMPTILQGPSMHLGRPACTPALDSQGSSWALSPHAPAPTASYLQFIQVYGLVVSFGPFTDVTDRASPQLSPTERLPTAARLRLVVRRLPL